MAPPPPDALIVLWAYKLPLQSSRPRIVVFIFFMILIFFVFLKYYLFKFVGLATPTAWFLVFS
jgi:hypothetical protein